MKVLSFECSASVLAGALHFLFLARSWFRRFCQHKKFETMRLLLLFLTLFLFKKDAVAVVQTAGGNRVQLIENQPVKLMKWQMKTKNWLATSFLFSKKKTAHGAHITRSYIPEERLEMANTFAKVALIVGLVACALFIPAILLVNTELVGLALTLWELTIILPLPAIILAILALVFKTRKKISAELGIFFSLLSWTVSILIAIALSGD